MALRYSGSPRPPDDDSERREGMRRPKRPPMFGDRHASRMTIAPGFRRRAQQRG